MSECSRRESYSRTNALRDGKRRAFGSASSARRHPQARDREGHTGPMLHLRVTTPSALTDDVLNALTDDPAVSSVVVFRDAAVVPEGDVVQADIAREATNEIVERLE